MRSTVIGLLRPLARKLPPLWRAHLRRWWYSRATPVVERTTDGVDGQADQGYEDRKQQEISRFAVEEVINDLPSIFDYWSNKYLRPSLEGFGFSYPEDFFARQIEKQAGIRGRPVRVISIGAGNCDSEVVVAKLLRDRGVEGFRIDCLDITQAMLERGRSLAQREGLDKHFAFVQADFNRWYPSGTYDVVMANQSLHHVTNLEGLFDAIHQAIGDDGIFITSDMIGRNGHMRWPEALTIVQEFWKELPTDYRYNVQLHRQEHVFGNWDCSVEGFEGIRAQDILPLLVQRFGFDFFFGYGNLVDPFIDRSFGPNFSVEKEWDREFIDRVHARDEEELLSGRIKPTHALAVMRRDRKARPQVWRHLTPEFCVRATD